jgi:polysaccharide export outer membrane protein
MNLLNNCKLYIAAFLVLITPVLSWAAADELTIIEDAVKNAPNNDAYMDPVKYTLGAEDVVDITVMRHPEFSGIYPINLEGKIQYKFVGDIDVTGLTKKELEKKIADIIGLYVINPEVNVTITEYKSKVIYILGEVSQPGKFYMQSESIPVREAVVRAGLPTLSAAMRKCRIVTPSKTEKGTIKYVDLYSILYGGELKKNIDMYPGDVLYVPSTVMTKVIRIINPISSTVGLASSTPENMNTGKAAIKTLAK